MKKLALRDGETLIDLGAAYGRLGFVLARHFPCLRFIGYELLPERVAEGQRAYHRHQLAHASLVVADLSAPEFRPATAAAYFVYDFGTRAAIEKCLGDLRAIAIERPISVVGRGRAVRDAIERHHPWLAEVVAPEHRPHYSIYRSAQPLGSVVKSGRP